MRFGWQRLGMELRRRLAGEAIRLALSCTFSAIIHHGWRLRWFLDNPPTNKTINNHSGIFLGQCAECCIEGLIVVSLNGGAYRFW